MMEYWAYEIDNRGMCHVIEITTLPSDYERSNQQISYQQPCRLIRGHIRPSNQLKRVRKVDYFFTITPLEQ